MPPMHRVLLASVNAHVAVAVADSVVPLTPPASAAGVLLQVTGADVRFTIDGTTPVGGSTGFLLYDTHDPLLVDLGNQVTLKFIRNATTSASLQYQFVRQIG